MKDEARLYKKGGKPTHLKERTINSDFDIILIDRLLKDTYKLCGSNGNIEMHHLKKLKDLENNGRKEKPEWMKRMMEMDDTPKFTRVTMTITR